jgi:flagellar biosynthesis/type III secretory pathway protein FliH
LRRAFAAWINQVLLEGRFPEQQFPALAELNEVHDMLAERVKNWTEQWKQEGLEQGRQEGMKEGLQAGRIEGSAAMLQNLLTLKFGPLPDAALEQIRQADSHALILWSGRVLTASTWEEIFQ